MKKEGLFGIVLLVGSKMKIAILLASISSLSYVASLALLAFALSHLLLRETLILFGVDLDLFGTVLILTVLSIVAFLSKIGSFGISHIGAFELEQILRSKLVEHLAKISLGHIISNGSGAFKKVLQDDVRNLHAFVADSVPLMARSIVTPIAVFALLVATEYRLAFAVLLLLIVGFGAMKFALRDSKDLRSEYDKSHADINKTIIEFIQAMPTVRAFESDNSSFTRYSSALGSYKQNLNRWMSVGAFSSRLAMVILSPLPTLLVVLMVGILLLDLGMLEISGFILALFLSTTMADSLMPIMWLQNHIKKAHASALKIEQTLSIKTLPLAKDPKDISSYDVEFRGVFFAYDDTKPYALRDISFKVEAKSTTAIVGKSGAGKSTITKLISRFWDTTKGSICIGGVDIRDLSSQTLTNSVSFVFQDTFLFNDTIYNNLKLANSVSSKEQIIKACKAAQIHDFIATLPDGYETFVGEGGADLSGGQRQRITIARAILRDTPIIVLDEATAFVDPQNEEAITKALASLVDGKTLIIIAHRLSTIKDTTQIVVLDDAKISEMGTHHTLLQNGGIYAELWSKQKKASLWSLQRGRG